jgi:hypothetical protein
MGQDKIVIAQHRHKPFHSPFAIPKARGRTQRTASRVIHSERGEPGSAGSARTRKRYVPATSPSRHRRRIVVVMVVPDGTSNTLCGPAAGGIGIGPSCSRVHFSPQWTVLDDGFKTARCKSVQSPGPISDRSDLSSNCNCSVLVLSALSFLTSFRFALLEISSDCWREPQLNCNEIDMIRAQVRNVVFSKQHRSTENALFVGSPCISSSVRAATTLCNSSKTEATAHGWERVNCQRK